MDFIKKNSFIKDALVLFFITLSLGFCLSIVKKLTDEPIRIADENARKIAFAEVCEDFYSSEDISSLIKDKESGNISIEACHIVKNSEDENIGYIMEMITKGYGGNFKLIVGFDNDKNITGIAYPSTLQETPGLGMKVTTSFFKDSFLGKNYNNINTVDTISGATMSSKAVKNAVNFSLSCLEKIND